MQHDKPQKRPGRPLSPEMVIVKQIAAENAKRVATLTEEERQAHNEQLKKQKEWVDASRQQWHQMRMNGITLRYLEMLDAMDPELMEPHQLLSQEEAEEKYAIALIQIDEALMRRKEARKAGIAATHERSATLRQYLEEKFPDVIMRLRSNRMSAAHAERVIRIRSEEKKTVWPGWDNGGMPSSTTLRKALKNLAKATRA